ncbi:MAG: hypothetical protein JWR88_1540, partial [Pseudonocardia sp.]|nr:hypothetical protein [Pseudonocardia sp.]
TGDTALPGGGRLTRERVEDFDADSYTLHWPDGSTAWLDPIGAYGIRLFAALAPGRRGQVRGLLGDFDGDGGNDVTARDGTVLPVRSGPPSFDDLYHRFGDSWRVGGTESLFDYDPGKNTDTFTDRSFPDKAATLDDLDAQARASGLLACALAGVRDQAQLAECGLDVGLTGQPAFAITHADTANVLVAPTTPSGGGGTTTTISSFRVNIGNRIGRDVPVPGAGQLTTNDTHLYEFFGRAGQVLQLSEPSGACSIFAEVRVANAQIPRVVGPSAPLCRPAPAFALPADGAYEVAVTGPAGAFGFVISEQNVRRFTVRDGDTVGLDRPAAGAGRLLAGQRDLFALDIGDGAGVWLNNLAGDCTVSVRLVGPTGVAGAPQPVCSGPSAVFREPVSGVYKLEVSGPAGGRYAFDVVSLKVQEGFAAVGGELTGRLDSPGRTDRYTVVAGPGKLRLTGGRGACSEVALRVTDQFSGAQIGPPSAPLCADTAVDLAEQGVYSVEVFGNGGRTGDYSVRLEAG